MIGQVVGSYRIAGVIGEGGMGVVYVYLVRDPEVPGGERIKLHVVPTLSHAAAARITVCRDGGLRPRTRRPVTPPRRAPDSARGAMPREMEIE